MKAPLKLYYGLFFVLHSLDNIVMMSSQNFTVSPMNVTTYIGAHARFRCFHDISPVYTWYVNGLTLSMRENLEHNESCSHGLMFDTEDEVNTTLSANVKNLIVRESPRECNGLQIQCEASTINPENMRPTDSQKSRTAVLMLEELRLTALKLLGSNGSTTITWELPIYIMDQDNVITYELNVDPLGDSTGIMPQCIPLSGSSVSMHTYRPRFASACDEVTITVVPFINEQRGLESSENGTLYQDLSNNIDYSITIAAVTFDGMDMELEYGLSANQIHVCFLSISAKNLRNNDTFELRKKIDSQQTTLLTFRVNNMELPFDEDYNVTMEIKNPRTLHRTPIGSINLSTQAIQNTEFYENHLLQLSYVRNTSARGALIVVGKMQSHQVPYDYIAVSKEGDIMDRYNISDYNTSCRFDCTLLVYTIHEDGLPKLNRSLRPVMNSLKHTELHLQESLSGPADMMSNQNNAIKAKVEYTGRLMKFSCSVDDTDGESDIEGCIAIVHSDVDSSILIANKVKRNTEYELFLNETLFEGDKHPYAIFSWKKRSGLLESGVIDKGTAERDDVGPTRTPPEVIAGIVVGVIIIIIIVLVANRAL